MNRISPLQWTLLALTVLVLAGGTYAWFQFMEKSWLAIPHQSVDAIRNPMLIAERLLRGRGYDSRADLTLPILIQQELPRGTLVLTDNRGLITPAQAEALMAWVAEGNTLVLQPQWQAPRSDTADDADAEDDGEYDDDAIAELVERDPIGVWFGVSQTSRVMANADADLEADDEADSDTDNQTENDDSADAVSSTDEQTATESAPPDAAKTSKQPIEYAHLRLPTHGYDLLIQQQYSRLVNADDGAEPWLADAEGEAIQIFSEGNGRVVFLASEPFNNRSIRRADHAELLLALAALNESGKAVRFVTELDMPAWYEALWQQFRWALICAFALLLMWLWRAVVRFGPVVAEPDPARRAQLEHVQASARWLWRLRGGREQLLAAVRADVEAVLLRHLPQLQRLQAEARPQQIAEHCALPLADVVFALQAPAAPLPVDFTRQIHLLQRMRQHHERND